jgi:lipoprotein-releasing system permease protein
MGFEFFIAKRYLKSKRKGLFTIITTIIGVAGVAIGVAALITTLSVMNGFQDDIQKKIIGAQSHVIVMGQMPESEYKNYEEKISKLPEVAAISPVTYGQAIISEGQASIGIVLKGINPETEKNVSDLTSSLTKGKWEQVKRKNDKNVPPYIVLGEELANNMGIWVGDDVVLISPKSIVTSIGSFPKMKKFRVSGTLKTGYYEFDNTMGYVDIKSAADFFNMNEKIGGFEIKLHDLNDAKEVADRVAYILGFKYHVKTFAEMNQTLFSALKLEKFVMFLILALIILVATFNIASNLILLGTEKLRDIGILRAMGATSKNIRRIFLFEGLLVGTLGLVFGLILGLTLCWIIATYSIVELPGDVYYLTKVPVAVKLKDIIIVIIGSYVLSFLATIYPAMRSSKVNPVDAIRYG